MPAIFISRGIINNLVRSANEFLDVESDNQDKIMVFLDLCILFRLFKLP